MIDLKQRYDASTVAVMRQALHRRNGTHLVSALLAWRRGNHLDLLGFPIASFITFDLSTCWTCWWLCWN
jgi:hypothetical protein